MPASAKKSLAVCRWQSHKSGDVGSLVSSALHRRPSMRSVFLREACRVAHLGITYHGTRLGKARLDRVNVSGRIPEQLIVDVRDRTDIVEVVGRHVALRRTGANHTGLCPFHEEKTPSFSVSSARQFYHCFGCQQSGDVIAFLMKVEGRSFTEVVEDLAAQAGIELERQQDPGAARRRSERQQALDLNRLIAQRYQACLTDRGGSVALRYLEERGIGTEVAQAFQLGYAPSSGSTITNLVRSSGIDLEFAVRMGALARRRQGEGFYDRFWNRLIFPVVDVGAQVLGFGGRLLGDADGPKYINTPETALYHKSDALYGMGPAASAIRQTRTALLVEGNFDVLQLHQHGFSNAVAPMGTALTQQQAKLLSRLADTVIAVFDGDGAGRAAAVKSVRTLVEAGLEARIGVLPQGADPDSFLREQGRDAVEQVFKDAIPGVDYLIEQLRRRSDGSIEGHAKLVEQVAPVVQALPSSIAREMYVDRLGMEFGVSRAVLARAFGQTHSGPNKRRSSDQQQRTGAQKGKTSEYSSAPEAELQLLKLLFEHPHLIDRAQQRDVASLLTTGDLRATYSFTVQMYGELGAIDPVRLLEAPHTRSNEVAKLVASTEFATCDPTAAFDGIVKRLTGSRIDQQRSLVASAGTPKAYQQLTALNRMKVKVNNAEPGRDMNAVWATIAELTEVEREIDETQHQG